MIAVLCIYIVALYIMGKDFRLKRQNIRYRYRASVSEDYKTAITVHRLERALAGDIRPAGLFLVRYEVGDGHARAL